MKLQSEATESKKSESELCSPAAALDARCCWTSAKGASQPVEALVSIGCRNSIGVCLSITLSQWSGLWRPSVVPVHERDHALAFDAKSAQLQVDLSDRRKHG
jgi:hypothetical protein